LKFELIVYGGTSAGVIAAAAAASRGKKAALVNPSRHLGGMTSGGLGATDMGNAEVIGGLARDFYRRIGRHYGVAEQWRFEPRAAEQIFDDLIKEKSITLFSQKSLRTIKEAGA
jgi:hypothetical protein